MPLRDGISSRVWRTGHKSGHAFASGWGKGLAARPIMPPDTTVSCQNVL